jgi:F-type H+-transporting ATPase subunit a
MGALEAPVFHTGPIPHHVAFSWLVMAVLLGLTCLVPRQPALVPRGVQNVLEAVLEFVLGVLDDVMGPAGRRFLPLIATLGLYIFGSNLLGLIPGFAAPTDNVNTTASCAIVVFFAYHWIGIRQHGLWPYLKHFAGPMPALAPLMVPIEVISHVARPLSLTLRLFGNIAGEHVVSLIFFSLMPFLLPVPMMLMGLFFGLIQAFVFVMLTVIYISGAVAHEH